MKGVLIGAMATLGLALVVILSFLWIRLLTKKERAAKKYTEVKKQVDPEASKKGNSRRNRNYLLFFFVNANLIFEQARNLLHSTVICHTHHLRS